MKSLQPQHILRHITPAFAALCIGLSAHAVHAQTNPENQYPTLARVEYVMDCIRQYPNVSQREMTYKCSCAIDAIAKEVNYDEYVDLSTVSSAISIAGERGAVLRDQKGMRPMANKFRDLQSKAKNACFIKD